MKYIFIFLIKKYIQVSPKQFRGKCVFTPSCSLYSLECFKRFGTFEDIKNVIDFFIDDKSEFITGQIIYLGGIHN